jgi:hypothetical protein
VGKGTRRHGSAKAGYQKHSTSKKLPASQNALRDLAPPKGKVPERLPPAARAKSKPAKRPARGLF